MASSSSCKFDVFLSFRGEDTRNNFISHLHFALCRKQIKTFIDEDLERGDEISAFLLKTIEGSKISVVIFSKNYASSKWCLDELVKILECHKTRGQMVVPVFYHVDPSAVRKQTESFGDAFLKLEKQFKDMPSKVQNWRAVLTEASNLSGWTSKEIRDEAQLVDVIVKDILKKLENATASTYSDGLLGLDSRIEKIKSLLCIGWPGFLILGIWGMGGIGKTTIAGAIFNQISREFEGKCFMANVREESVKGGGLIHLREQVLSEILQENIKVRTPDLPGYLRKRLQQMKVFIVLDDVNKVGQLQYLIGGLDRFGPGSRIIITTRDKRVLENFGVHTIYEVKGLEYHEALELFCNFAFKHNHRLHDLLILSQPIVEYANGNPLALKVLGSFLHLKSKLDWEYALKNLKLISEPDIYDVLKISYNELKSEEKNMFLDISCFFAGEDKDFVIKLLEVSHYVLNVLIDKSLISISDDNILEIHDLLQEMGRQIICQESLKQPGKRSRLWHHEDIYHVLKKNKGTAAIEGIFLDLSKIRDLHLSSTAFANMSNLRLLKFYMPEDDDVPIMNSKVHLDQDLGYLSEELRYLHWHEYPWKSLPSDFDPENLIELNLPYSKVEQIWEGEKEAPKLKSIDLHHSQYLTAIPERFEIPNLERINLSNCESLSDITSCIQNFNNLSMLCLRGCKSLRSFSSNIHFVSPITIDFSCCVNLSQFPLFSGDIIELDLSETAIEEVPSSIGCLTNLKELRLCDCTRLKRLSTGICKLKSLLLLRLYGCLNLEIFPEIMEKMEHLKVLCLEKTPITELPSSIEMLEGLQQLILEGCTKLDNLPDNMGNLKSLVSINGNGSAIGRLPSSFTGPNSLTSLRFSGCRGFVQLPRLLSGIFSLRRLDFSDCNLMEIPQDISCLSSLEELNLSGNIFETLPGSIKQLSRLTYLFLRNCHMLQSLPELPLSLIYLGARNCKQLQSLPEIPALLEELDASVLEKLSEIPPACDGDPFSLLKSSVRFMFTNCLRLHEKANNKILEYMQRRIQHLAIAFLTPFVGRIFVEPVQITYYFPGSEIPNWFTKQRSGSSIAIQLPQHCCNRKFMGFALCVVTELEEYLNADDEGECIDFLFDTTTVKCDYRYEIKTLSETKHINRHCDLIAEETIESEHVIIGFDPGWNFRPPEGEHHVTVLFQFCVTYEYFKIKCGVCPIYANTNGENPQLYKFADTSYEEEFMNDELLAWHEWDI